MTPVEFTMPLKTDVSLNSRGSWFTKAAKIKRQRTATFYAILATKGMRGIGAHLPLTIHLTRIVPRAHWSILKHEWIACDDDNLPGYLKAVRDEIANAIGVDDGDDRLTWRYHQDKGPMGVRVRIEPREAT